MGKQSYVLIDGVWIPMGTSSSGHAIYNGSTLLTSRANLKFTGTGVTASDDGVDSTVVTIAATIGATGPIGPTGATGATGEAGHSFSPTPSWTIDTTATTFTTITSGNIRFDSATQASITKMWVHITSFEGFNCALGLDRCLYGGEMYFRAYADGVSSVFSKFRLISTAVVRNAGTANECYELGVTKLDGSATAPSGRVELQRISPASVGVPLGGTSGQVLSKSGSGDYAIAWTTPATAGGGGAGTAAYTLNTSSTSAPPATSEIRADAALATATTLYISNTDFDGGSMATSLSRFQPENELYMQEYADSSKWITYRINGAPTAGSGYYNIFVTKVGGSATAPAAGKVEIQRVTQASVGVPLAGSVGQVLYKTSSSNFALGWTTLNGALPSGGTTGQTIVKASATDYHYSWSTLSGLAPTGGTSGQVLAKTSSTDYAYAWTTPATASGGIPDTAAFTLNTSSTSAPPAAGEIRANAALATATTLYVSNTDAAGSSVTSILPRFLPANQLYMQETADSSKWVLYLINGTPAAGSGYYNIFVTKLSGSTTAPAAGNIDIYRVTPATAGVPRAGSVGNVLYKTANTDFSLGWTPINQPPSGGTTGQVLSKLSATDYHYGWSTLSGLAPAAGTTGQVLKKNSATNYDYSWAAAGIASDNVAKLEVMTTNTYQTLPGGPVSSTTYITPSGIYQGVSQLIDYVEPLTATVNTPIVTRPTPTTPYDGFGIAVPSDGGVISSTGGSLREKRTGVAEPAINNYTWGSTTNLDLTGSTRFRYLSVPAGIPMGGGMQDQFVQTDYKPGSSAAIQAAAWPFNLDFITDSAQVELRLYATAANMTIGRIEVDGVPVSTRAISYTNPAAGAVIPLLTFPTAVSRRITIWGLNNTIGLFGGVWVNSGKTVTKPSTTITKRIAFIGDSYVSGAGAGAESVALVETFTTRLKARMGGDDLINAGIGGTGYVIQNALGSISTFRSRVASVMALSPHIVFLVGGRNDGATGLQTEVEATLDAIGGSVQRYVVPTASESGQATTRAAMKAAALAKSVPYLDIGIDSLPKIADGVHPSWAGHNQMADLIYTAIP